VAAAHSAPPGVAGWINLEVIQLLTHHTSSVVVAVVLFFALLVSYPWLVLTIGTLAYLACLPLGWTSYQRHLQADVAAGASVAQPAPAPAATPPLSPQSGDERPARLN